MKALAAGSGGGWHKPVRSDCLLKTQVRAKSQARVFGNEGTKRPPLTIRRGFICSLSDIPAGSTLE